MKQKKFKIKSSILVKFRSSNSSDVKWSTDPTTTTFTTTTTTTGIFNK